MQDSNWNKFHPGTDYGGGILETGIYDYTVTRIIYLDPDRFIQLAFDVNGVGIAANIYFEKEPYTIAKSFMASAGLIKSMDSPWTAGIMSNSVGKSGRCIVGQYRKDGAVRNRMAAYLIPGCDEKRFLWQYLVVKNAGHKCFNCGGYGDQAHHIKPWSLFPEDRYDIENGMCLCKKCHDTWHDQYGTMVVGGPGL